MKLKEILTSFQGKLRFKFLTKKEILFLVGSFIILSIFVYFNFDDIESSNLASSTTEISYAGLLAFVLAKYFFKKEEISISKKELKAKLSNLAIIALETDGILKLLQENSKEDLSFYEFTLSKSNFKEKKEIVFQNLKDIIDQIDIIRELTKRNFIEVPSIMSLLKETKEYLSSSLTKFKQEDYPYMELEITNGLVTLNSFKKTINNLMDTCNDLLKNL